MLARCGLRLLRDPSPRWSPDLLIRSVPSAEHPRASHEQAPSIPLPLVPLPRKAVSAGLGVVGRRLSVVCHSSFGQHSRSRQPKNW